MFFWSIVAFCTVVELIVFGLFHRDTPEREERLREGKELANVKRHGSNGPPPCPKPPPPANPPRNQ